MLAMDKIEIRFGGMGGQGVVLAAQILAKAAVMDGRNALQTQAYGAEARGSLTKSEVIISKGKIGFPAVRKSDMLVTMSQEATDLLCKDLKEKGILMVDGGNVKKIPTTDCTVHKFPITETAMKKFGEKLYVNMIMLGALIQLVNLVSADSIEKAIVESTLGRNAETNVKAFREGLSLSEC